MEKVKQFFVNNRNLLLTLLLVIVVIVGVFYISKLGEDKYFKELSYNNYEDYIKKEGNLVLFASKEDNDALNSTSSFANEKGIKFRYIYTEDLNEEQKEKVLDGETSKLYFGGKEVKETDDITILGIKEFLVENKVINRSMTQINMDQYEELMKNDNFVVVVVRTGCHYCEMFEPVIDEVSQEYDFPIYNVDISTFDEEDYNRLVASAKYFSEEEWGTPTTVVYHNGKVVDVQSGYSEKEPFVEFLKSTNVIK